MVASLYFAAPAGILQWLIVMVLLGVFAWGLLRDWRREPQGFGCDQGQWYLRQQGEREPVVLHHSHFITRGLGVIGFAAADGSMVSIVILPDSMSPGDCHRLAVALV